MCLFNNLAMQQLMLTYNILNVKAWYNWKTLSHQWSTINTLNNIINQIKVLLE